MNKKISAYIMYIGAMLIFGSIGIFRRFIQLPSGMLAWFRGFSGAVIIFLASVAQGKKICNGIGMKNVLFLALSGGMIGLNWVLLFEAFNKTSVPIATLCNYMEPSIVILLAPLFLRERLTLKKLICAAVSVIGMIFVSGVIEGGGLKSSDISGIIPGLGAALLYALAVIVNKKVSVEDTYEKSVIQLMAASVAVLPYVLLKENLSEVSLTGKSVIMLAVVCVIHTGLAYILFVTGMESLKAHSIAVLGYIDPVSALFFSAVFLSEKLTILGLFGAVLIIGSALICEIPFPIKNKRDKA